MHQWCVAALRCSAVSDRADTAKGYDVTDHPYLDMTTVGSSDDANNIDVRPAVRRMLELQSKGKADPRSAWVVQKLEAVILLLLNDKDYPVERGILEVMRDMEADPAFAENPKLAERHRRLSEVLFLLLECA